MVKTNVTTTTNFEPKAFFKRKAGRNSADYERVAICCNFKSLVGVDKIERLKILIRMDLRLSIESKQCLCHLLACTPNK